MIKLAVRIALVMVTFAIADARAAEMLEAEVLEPDGYRLEEYRAPTPATLRGAKAIGTQEAEKIWRSHSASFIDVLPRPPVGCSWSWRYSMNQTAIFAPLTSVNSRHHRATGFDQAKEFARAGGRKFMGLLRL